MASKVLQKNKKKLKLDDAKSIKKTKKVNTKWC